MKKERNNPSNICNVHLEKCNSFDVHPFGKGEKTRVAVVPAALTWGCREKRSFDFCVCQEKEATAGQQTGWGGTGVGCCWFCLNCCLWAAGKHPPVGPDKEPLEKGSIFAELAGQPLHHKKYKGILWSVIGDQDFFPTHLGYPTGVVRLHVGNVMHKIVFHVPLEKGTKKSIWKSRGSRSPAMWHLWQTHLPHMLCSLCLG